MRIKSSLIVFVIGLFSVVVMLGLIVRSDARFEENIKKTYVSKTFNISFTYPDTYKVREDLNDIYISKDNKQIRMSLAGGAGQTTDAKSYMDSIAQRNSISFDEVEPVKTELFEGYAAAVSAPGLPRTLHYYLADGSGTILVITTQYAELADDINAIIGSFRRPSQ